MQLHILCRANLNFYPIPQSIRRHVHVLPGQANAGCNDKIHIGDLAIRKGVVVTQILVTAAKVG